MPIRTTCPGCQTNYSLVDHQLGKRVRCPKCSEVMTVRDAAESVDEKDNEAGGTRSRQRQHIQANPRERKRLSEWGDEEDGDSPQQRRRRVKSRRGVIALVVGGLALLLGGSVLAAILLFGRFKDKSADRLGEFSGPWPEPSPLAGGGAGIAADNTVVLHIIVGDRNTREVVTDKLLALMETERCSFTSSSHGDRMTVLLAPVRDPNTFAGRIDFGTVRGVQGRTIHVVASKVEGPPPNADTVTEALFRLKSPNGFRRSEAARILKGTPPNHRREEVARALEPLLRDREFFTRMEAVEALGTWGTKESVPLLLDVMGEDFLRHSVMKALGRLKAERAIEPLAACLVNFSDRRPAAEALKDIGPAAEKVVIKYLSHHDPWVRGEACEILEAVGSRDSIPALEKLLEDDRLIVKSQAEQAIKAIRSRR